MCILSGPLLQPDSKHWSWTRKTLQFVSWTVWKPGKVPASGELGISPEFSNMAPPAPIPMFYKLSGGVKWLKLNKHYLHYLTQFIE